MKIIFVLILGCFFSLLVFADTFQILDCEGITITYPVAGGVVPMQVIIRDPDVVEDLTGKAAQDKVRIHVQGTGEPFSVRSYGYHYRPHRRPRTEPPSGVRIEAMHGSTLFRLPFWRDDLGKETSAESRVSIGGCDIYLRGGHYDGAVYRCRSRILHNEPPEWRASNP